MAAWPAIYPFGFAQGRLYGTYRTTPTQTVTDRHFTGHKHNDDLGLVYMNARFYVPSIGRFASAHTIVPNPANPQSYNRYSYVLSNPLRYSDPTGHAECATEDCDLTWHPKSGNVVVRDIGTSPAYRLVAQFAGAGTAAKSQLEKVLEQTASTFGGRNFKFMGHFTGIASARGDYGFQSEFQDDHLYADQWGIATPASRQSGHFLSAVSMGYDRGIERWVWLYLIVRHEQYSDGTGGISQLLGLVRQATPIEHYEAAISAGHIQWFLEAVAADATGDYSVRDNILDDIFSPQIYGDQRGRVGNSLEDLRLSVRGWRLGNLVASGDLQTSQDIANWLTVYVVGD